MVHGDVRTCSRDRKTLDADHQSARRTTRVHEGSSRGMQERAPSTRTEKVGQILDMTHRWGKSHDPGLYAAFPWGGYAQSKGDAPSTAHPPIRPPHNSSRGLSETIVEVRRQARTPPGQVR